MPGCVVVKGSLLVMRVSARACPRLRPHRCATPAVLVVCGLLIAALDGLLVWRFPLFRYLPAPGSVTGTVGMPEIFGDSWRTEICWYAGIFTLQFLLYGAALGAVRRSVVRSGGGIGGGVGGVGVVFALSLLFAALLVFLYPLTAVDLIHYLAAARIFGVWGENPLVVPHGAYPFPMALNYPDLPSPYGPL